jgi:hypothetical protein
VATSCPYILEKKILFFLCLDIEKSLVYQKVFSVSIDHYCINKYSMYQRHMANNNQLLLKNDCECIIGVKFSYVRFISQV